MKKPPFVALRYVPAVLLALVSTTVLAQDETENESDDVLVVPIEVEATKVEVKPGQASYSSETIETTPVGEGNLADLLRINPAVDFSRSSGLSAGTATLRPAEIAIHGQQFYQNLFMIDGTDTTNDLNPAAAKDLWSTPSLVAPIGGSSPQGYYLDVELLDNVEVLDSNIPVEYGGFTGGVVAAEVKSYQGINKLSAHYGLQKDEWEKFHLTEDDISTADKFRAVYTPEYEKSNYGLTVQSSLGEDFGLTLGITKRQSTFAQEYEDDADVLRMIDYDDEISNVVGRVDTKIEDMDIGVSFRYTNRQHDGLTSTTYTGGFVKEHSGRGGTVEIKKPLGKDMLETIISIDTLSDSLDSAHSWFTYHEYLESSGMSRFEGAFGDMNQEQTRINIAPKLVMNPEMFANFEHTVTIGGSFRSTSSFYERPETIVYEQYYCVRDNGREGCRDQDGDGVSSAGDEYLNRRWFYEAGSVELDYNEVAFYAQTEMVRNQWEFTLGARADWGSFLDNFDIAPRLSGAYTFESRPSRKILFGTSRYYGRSFLRYQLNDAIYGWRESYTNLTRPRGRAGEEVPCSVPDWTNCTHLTYDNRTGISDIDTPFSDEYMLGWSDEFGSWSLGLQYVNRNGRKGVSRKRDDDGLYYYTNEGKSETNSVTFDVLPPVLSIGKTETQFVAALSYRDYTSNRQDDDGYDEQIDEDLVYYKGSLVPFDELPAWDYNIPIGIRLSSITTIGRPDITWSNFYNFRKGGTIARDSRENYTSPDTGVVYDIYEDFEFDQLFTVDSRIQWSQQLRENTEFYVRFEIHNIFDNVMDTSLFDTRKRYTKGRRFWVEFGISTSNVF